MISDADKQSSPSVICLPQQLQQALKQLGQAVAKPHGLLAGKLAVRRVWRTYQFCWQTGMLTSAQERYFWQVLGGLTQQLACIQLN